MQVPHRRILSVATVLVSLVALSLIVTPPTTAQTTLSAYEQQVVVLVNAERAANGLQPLTVSTRLSTAARAHNMQMIQTGEFAHQVTGELPVCPSPFQTDRYRAVGYNWQACGENIAAMAQTPEAAMTSWMNSAPHRANILSPAFTEIGVGYTLGGPYGVYWTQDFGTPNAPTSISSDLDGDGEGDFVWRHTPDGQNVAWITGGTSVAAYAGLPPVAGTNWAPVGIGDVNGDGMADLVWRNSATGQVVAWLMNSNIVASYAWLPNVADTNWKLVAAADLDGDGTADLVWRNTSTRQVNAWLMNGGSVASYNPLPTLPDVNWQLAAAGDLDGDGKADLVWRNKSTGQNVAWLMNGVTVASYAWLPTVPVDQGWTLVAVGDLNADLKADLVWRNTSTGQNIAWLMDGGSVTTYAWLPSVTGTDWTVIAVNDLNGDLKADLIWRNSSTGQTSAWLMNGGNVLSYSSLPTVSDPNWQPISPTLLARG